ncbi:MAG: DHHW family protein [Muribaculaceae bacterium]|nr:DHHW family protein [Roseburia sp.]MCM1429946.1 DHHW family protein [Muribaculaceae bacterium]MCM1493027.1 DHHW family protein [Muribaculaceae bacterium]
MKRRYVAVVLMSAVLALGGCGDDKEDVSKGNTEQQGGASEISEASEVSENTVQETESPARETVDGTEFVEPPAGTEEEPGYPEITSDKKVVDYGTVVRVGDAVYELYTYVDDAADAYAMAVNKAAEELEQKADVYNLVVPLGSGIVFPDNLKDQLSCSDQQEAMQQIHGKMDSGVISVDIYDSLMTHRDEYIYFRTDHHWTALGAYYAYQDFCEAKGIVPEELDSYETKVFDGFLGSFYNDTNKNKKLKKNPDTVTAYLPNMDAVCHVEDAQGVKYDSPVIYDETNAGASLKYSAFIAGDNPYTEIVNSELTDGSACIVVKESFGNAFIPFLVDHYQTIYVIDYRYWSGSISGLAGEKGVEDVIFINNLSMIRNKSLIGKLYRVI